MAKLPKLTSVALFNMAHAKAVADVDRQRGKATWTEAQLDEIAKSAAIQYGICNDLNHVHPAVVAAIRIGADPQKSDAEKEKARDEAWRAYSAHK